MRSAPNAAPIGRFNDACHTGDTSWTLPRRRRADTRSHRSHHLQRLQGIKLDKE